MASVKTKDGTNAMPDDQQDVESSDRQESDRDRKGLSEPVAYKTPGTEMKKPGRGFFTIYKKGQGYWTRMGTAMTAGLIAIFTMQFIYEQVRAHASNPLTAARTAWIAVGIFFVIFALVVFFLTNKPNVVDFLIATDSEMKKVNWTTKAELIGSTKVVILFMIVIMIFLFAFDTIFGYFFKFINVLQVGPFG